MFFLAFTRFFAHQTRWQAQHDMLPYFSEFVNTKQGKNKVYFVNVLLSFVVFPLFYAKQRGSY
jgi:hypothetical protein